MAESGPVTRALVDTTRSGADDRDLAAQICRACLTGMNIDGAALSVFTASVSRTTLSATDATAAQLEDLQFTLGEGACLQAAATGRPVLVPDLYDPRLTVRWPVFAAAVSEQTGVRALFALPLQLETINLGVLDLYRNTPGPLSGTELRDVLAATDTATLMMLAAHNKSGDEYARDDRWWHRSSKDRAQVRRATEKVLNQLGIPGQDAFARLRAHAFAEHRPLGDVARDVLEGRLQFTEDMD
jgi:GAF domain